MSMFSKDMLLEELSKAVANFDDYKRMQDLVEQRGISEEQLKDFVNLISECRGYAKNALIDIQRKLKKGDSVISGMEDQIKHRNFVARAFHT